ncbi:L,D-transpeptidase [Mycolicibacterium goodii]|uniref:L,D-transpeptidase family protein n=1 Tax=Mycolicibacterium goodii TaxID=134601 RepID=A0ABS6HJB3_MYCGD|nr:L,D-transpeptidase family protein [Mycolicibacterium goodii]MBU8822782.1 L,D-transpeptidase family protein [Mycolicibacterium goodii]MBU8838876.1 L,D-transpeptidase family protein [Mycolicibacterium goodii]
MHHQRLLWVATTLTTLTLAASLVSGPPAFAEPEGPLPPAPVEPIQLPPSDPLALPPAGDPLPAPAASLGQPVGTGTPAGQNPLPFTGQPPFLPPSFNPVNGSLVGVAKPIYINFQRPIADRQMAEDAIHISSNPPVPGKFYWMSDTQVRWRPIDFWPAGTVVNIDAAGTKSNFRVGDALVATIDDKTHQMEIVRNGKLEKTFPISLGKPGYETPNGTYYVLEKFADIVMDSSTYGVPVNSPEGYKLKVQNAVRIDNSGIFVHSAPWSVADQGKRNVSHGCPNLSPANAQWFFDNFGSGDPVVVKNSVGLYDQPDGAQDWQI